jgi:hypothetical protein
MGTISTETESANSTYAAALEFHKRRCVTDAGRAYKEALTQSSPRPPTEDEIELILRHAPRVFTTPSEPLPLKDFAAILHPQLPLIGYHFFWEDDIDFPLDRDPCDHEVIWVQLDESRNDVANVYTYYHSHVLSFPAAAEDARCHGGRPRIEVQWGKHGSMPLGWQEIGDGAVLADMQRTYKRLHTQGARDAGHPLARNWPTHFTGSWEEFVDFSHEVDPRDWLRAHQMMIVGELANAIIFWYFLRYNFCPKYSWPDLERPGGWVW